MLNDIINAIPADPTKREVKVAMNANMGVGAPGDFAELLEELLNAGLGDGFYNEAYALLMKGVKMVNDRYEEDMFGVDTYETMMEDADMYAL